MRKSAVMVSILLLATPAMAQESEPLGACADAVGTFLLSDAHEGEITSRTLFRLSSDGAATFVDSGQWGSDDYEPFSDALGSWVCLSGPGEALAFRAVVIDFTAPAEGGQTVARVDIDGTLDPDTGMMTLWAALSFFPFDGDPLVGPVEGADPFTLTGQRITAE